MFFQPFVQVNQISYPPSSEDGNSILIYNRASTNKFQTFYGAVEMDDPQLDQLTAIVEVGAIIDKDFNQSCEYVVLGQWFPKKSFTVAALGLHSELAKVNLQAKNMKEFHSQFASNNKERGESIELVAEFMSQEFSKKVEKGKDWDYKISAAYGDSLFEAGIQGILFKAEGKSFNIAVNSKTVDEALDIRVAAITRSRFIGGEIFVDWFKQSPTIIDGNLNWEDPPPTAIIGEAEEREILKNMENNGGKFVNNDSATVTKGDKLQ